MKKYYYLLGLTAASITAVTVALLGGPEGSPALRPPQASVAATTADEREHSSTELARSPDETVVVRDEVAEKQDTIRLEDLIDDPEQTINSIGRDPFDRSAYSDEDIAHFYGLAHIKLSNLLNEGREPYQALRRLPSIDELARLAGVSLSEVDRNVIGGMLPKYQVELDRLAPLAASEANRSTVEKFESKAYSLLTRSGDVVRESPQLPHALGEYRWVTTIGCLGCDHSISFSYNSGEFPEVDALFQQIGDIKSSMKAEVLEYMSSI